MSLLYMSVKWCEYNFSDNSLSFISLYVDYFSSPPGRAPYLNRNLAEAFRTFSTFGAFSAFPFFPPFPFFRPLSPCPLFRPFHSIFLLQISVFLIFTKASAEKRGRLAKGENIKILILCKTFEKPVRYATLYTIDVLPNHLVLKETVSYTNFS